MNSKFGTCSNFQEHPFISLKHWSEQWPHYQAKPDWQLLKVLHLSAVHKDCTLPLTEARKAQCRSTTVQTLEDSLFIWLNLQIWSSCSSLLPFPWTRIHNWWIHFQEASLQIRDIFRLVDIIFYVSLKALQESLKMI